ncbi:MAG: hypothetical protein IKI67_04970 [Bacteroidales bacterium]|nr:hypothetical protein [Bacteroidales bacterium]
MGTDVGYGVASQNKRSELPVYYHCRKERNRFFACAQNDRGRLRMTGGGSE